MNNREDDPVGSHSPRTHRGELGEFLRRNFRRQNVPTFPVNPNVYKSRTSHVQQWLDMHHTLPNDNNNTHIYTPQPSSTTTYEFYPSSSSSSKGFSLQPHSMGVCALEQLSQVKNGVNSQVCATSDNRGPDVVLENNE